MEFTEILPEFLKYVMTEGGFGAAVLAFFCIVLLLLYLWALRKNQLLTEMIIKQAEVNSSRYVEVVGENADAFSELSHSVDRLTDHTISLTGRIETALARTSKV